MNGCLQNRASNTVRLVEQIRIPIPAVFEPLFYGCTDSFDAVVTHIPNVKYNVMVGFLPEEAFDDQLIRIPNAEESRISTLPGGESKLAQIVLQKYCQIIDVNRPPAVRVFPLCPFCKQKKENHPEYKKRNKTSEDQAWDTADQKAQTRNNENRNPFESQWL